MNKLQNIVWFVVVTATILIISCDSHKNHFYSQSYSWQSGRATAPAYGNGSGNTSVSNISYYSSPTGYPNGDISDSKKAEKQKKEAAAGILTGGETNDLGKWELWNDMVKEALEEQIKLWKIYPYHRYTVLLQNNEGMPVHGAKIKLMNNQNAVLWESVTDNTGTAQLWKGIYTKVADTSVSEISIEYKNITEKIENPVDFFKGINTKKLNVSYEKSNKVDIAFVVDATGSMQDEIDFLKEELNNIISKTQNTYTDIDLQLGSVFYRCIGNSYTTRSISLTHEFSAVMNFIKDQNADEGGIEAVEAALDDAVNKLKWREDARTRLMFIVLDEPSGYYDTIVEKLHTVIQVASKKGIKIIPVVASGNGGGVFQDRNLEFLMRSTALATNGNYIFITDHSGVGGKHTEPIIDNYEVELVNDIIVRTIHNNIYMPEIPVKDAPVSSDTLLVDNSREMVDELLDSLSENANDSTLIASLLTYTDFKTAEELEQHKPIEKIDTTRFINDMKLDVHTLTIYPNPSSGMLKAEFNTDIDFLYLADLSGKILNRISVQETRTVSIDLTEYPNGFYLIQYPDKERWISAKIVLQK